MERFAGTAAIVTGAASGIGRATVARLAAEGATVVCVDRDEAGVASAAAAGAPGTAARALVCDVADEDAVRRTVADAVDGLGRLDVLVNMAGILTSADTHETDLATWDRVLAVNLTGTFLMCREALPHLVETGGNIVNAASTASLSGHPWMAAYAASKGGVLALTRSIAVEYARRGVRANAVAPGGITTPMTGGVELPDTFDTDLFGRLSPLDSFRGPETVASVIAFLASADAAHVNGEYVRCDGGTLA